MWPWIVGVIVVVLVLVAVALFFGGASVRAVDTERPQPRQL